MTTEDKEATVHREVRDTSEDWKPILVSHSHTAREASWDQFRVSHLEGLFHICFSFLASFGSLDLARHKASATDDGHQHQEWPWSAAPRLEGTRANCTAGGPQPTPKFAGMSRGRSHSMQTMPNMQTFSNVAFEENSPNFTHLCCRASDIAYLRVTVIVSLSALLGRSTAWSD